MRKIDASESVRARAERRKCCAIAASTFSVEGNYNALFPLRATTNVDLDEKCWPPYLGRMLLAAQCRAGRGWLQWSQEDLAQRAKVGLSTVRDFEAGRHTPVANNLRAIRDAFEANGIRFLFAKDGSADGIALTPPAAVERQ